MGKETDLVTARYARRAELGTDGRYSMLNPTVWQGVQERQRALISLLNKHTDKPLDQLQVLEIGCGSGGNLLELIRIGFPPDNLSGNELLPERVAIARDNLPLACSIAAGDANQMICQQESIDIVYQSTVFSSLLDDNYQNELASRMWQWVKPGGGILWYDFIYNNPNNSDVRGVTTGRMKELFPQGVFDIRKVTLAPPLSRRVCKIHPSLYTALNLFPFLRTHVLCWIGKKK